MSPTAPGPKPRPVAERFWEKVLVRDPDGCWPWQASRHASDYGHFKRAGRSQQAHRVSWELTNGPIPKGLDVLHSCDNPPCCNPAHLFVGDDAMNAADREAKGRGADHRGECNPRARLTLAAVDAIRAAYSAGGISQTVLAREHDVHQTTISNVVRGLTWPTE